MARRSPTWGLLALDSRQTSDALAPEGAGTYESAYTEAGPGPGHPVLTDPTSRWRPGLTDGQTVEVNLTTIGGGYPGREGASVAYDLGTETIDGSPYTILRGWSPPNVITHVAAPPSPLWDGSGDILDALALATNPVTHTVVGIMRRDASGDVRTFRYIPQADVWQNGKNWTDGLGEYPAMIYHPTVPGRLLLWAGTDFFGGPGVAAYYSDDDGDTWDLYSRSPFSDDVETFAKSVAVQAGADWLMMIANDGQQWASSDDGVTWDLVDSVAGIVSSPKCTPRPGGGYVVVYATGAAQIPLACILPTARTPITSVTPIEITPDLISVAVDTAALVTDYDGTIYFLARIDAENAIGIWYSTDAGATWSRYRQCILGDEAATGVPAVLGATCSGGATYLAVRGITNDSDFVLLRLGGWAGVESGNGAGAGKANRRFGWGYPLAGSSGGIGCFVPVFTPSEAGFVTATTGAPTTSITTTVGAWSISGTTGAGVLYDTNTVSVARGSTVVVGQACVSVPVGQVVGATAPTLVETRCDTATGSIRAQLRFGTNGVMMRDASAGTQLGATLSLTLTTDPVWIRWQVYGTSAGGYVHAWYRRPNNVYWVPWIVNEPITSGATAVAADTLLWGTSSTAAGIYTSSFYAVMANSGGEWLFGAPTEASGLESYVDGVQPIRYGRSIGLDGYPLPEAGVIGERVSYLRATGGPTYSGEEVTLPVAYTGAVTYVHPVEAPSPRRRWEATGTSTTTWVWDLDRAVWLGGAIGLVVVDAYLRTCTLTLDDGAGGWGTPVTFDKGWSSIAYTLTGASIRPRSGTAAIDRYLHEGELVGGYVVMSTGTTPVARRIIRQSAGRWTDDTTVQRVRIDLEGVDGTEDASGSGEIVAPSGVLVVYPDAGADLPRRYVRVQVASGQVVPGGAYRAGVVGWGRIVGVGAPPGWDWSATTVLPREESRGRDGALSVRRMGPAYRTLTYGWTDGLLLRDLRSSTADYVGTSAGAPIGSAEDPTGLLGLADVWLDAGEVPAVVLPALPTSSGTTITDPTIWLYGRLATDRATVSGVLGTEGTDEVVRLDGLSFDEIR